MERFNFVSTFIQNRSWGYSTPKFSFQQFESTKKAWLNCMTETAGRSASLFFCYSLRTERIDKLSQFGERQ